MSLTSMAVAPSTTWLLVSTRPSEVSTIPVPAACAPCMPSVVLTSTSPAETAPAIEAGSVAPAGGTATRAVCPVVASGRVSVQASRPTTASTTRLNVPSSTPSQLRRRGGGGGCHPGGGGCQPSGGGQPCCWLAEWGGQFRGSPGHCPYSGPDPGPSSRMLPITPHAAESNARAADESAKNLRARA